jgi:hypothetical protein
MSTSGGEASHRRNVAVASVIRRSHPGQSADSSRWASDQNTKVLASMGHRQYTHGTLRCAASTAVPSPGSLGEARSLKTSVGREDTVHRLTVATARGGEKARGLDESKRAKFLQCHTSDSA